MDEFKLGHQPALFGIDMSHIKRFHDAYVHSDEDEIRQIDILQEECAELIQALSKTKRIETRSSKEYIEARNHLIEELTHVSISSAVVSCQFFISQGEINLEVQRKDDLLTKPIFGFDESNGPDMTAGGTQS